MPVELFSRALAKISTNFKSFVSNPLALATGLTFAVDSCMFGSWVTHIPHIKTHLHLNDAELGLALFGLPIGMLLMNPLSAAVIGRFGLARTTVWVTILTAIVFSFPAWATGRWALLGALIIVGMHGALLNVAMNTCATNIERRDKIFIMSSCHGMWSLGGMVGSALSAIVIAQGIGPQVHLSTLSLLLGLFAFFYLRPLIQQIPENKSSSGGLRLALPNRDLLQMIFVGFCAHLGEGVAFDWSAVYLRDVLKAPEQIAALAFTSFSLTMMAMRFAGDVLIPRFGERRLLLASSAFTAFSLLIAILAPGPAFGILAFLCLGAGVALSAPILYNASSRIPGMAPGAGLASFATFSFIGFLAGPPMIGFISEAFGLRTGLGLVAVLCVGSLATMHTMKLR